MKSTNQYVRELSGPEFALAVDEVLAWGATGLLKTDGVVRGLAERISRELGAEVTTTVLRPVIMELAAEEWRAERRRADLLSEDLNFACDMVLRLKGTLRPFADFAEVWLKMYPKAASDSVYSIEVGNPARERHITRAHLEAALEALKK